MLLEIHISSLRYFEVLLGSCLVLIKGTMLVLKWSANLPYSLVLQIRIQLISQYTCLLVRVFYLTWMKVINSPLYKTMNNCVKSYLSNSFVCFVIKMSLSSVTQFGNIWSPWWYFKNLIYLLLDKILNLLWPMVKFSFLNGQILKE